MLAQRAVQQSLRRLAVSASKPSIASQMMFRPAVLSSSIQTRPVATQILNPKDSAEILAAQRKHRPTAPHLTIYKPQIPWIMSMFNRITGGILATGFYAFGLGYLAAPLVGIPFDSATLAAVFGSFPFVVKASLKFLAAAPFTYHAFNGVRHLIWDAAKQITNKQVIRSGQVVLGLTAVSSFVLAVFV